MPPAAWVASREAAVAVIEATGVPDVGALLSWAVWSVDTLHYLLDVDTALVVGDTPILGHPRDIVDVAHVRWATITAVTAIDQCAAVVGRVSLANRGPHESALVDFDPARGGRPQQNHAALSPAAQAWVATALADPDFRDLKTIRNPMAHAWRHRILWMEGPIPRTGFPAPGATRDARQLIELAATVALRHVDAFLAAVIVGGIP